MKIELSRLLSMFFVFLLFTGSVASADIVAAQSDIEECTALTGYWYFDKNVSDTVNIKMEYYFDGGIDGNHTGASHPAWINEVTESDIPTTFAGYKLDDASFNPAFLVKMEGGDMLDVCLRSQGDNDGSGGNGGNGAGRVIIVNPGGPKPDPAIPEKPQFLLPFVILLFLFAVSVFLFFRERRDDIDDEQQND